MTLRLVLDTNLVLSALLFSSGRLTWLRRAWQGGRIVPLVCKPSVEELLRVLSYPKFRLSSDEQQTLLADFLPYTETVALPESWPVLPACRDAHDQVFVVLAHVAHADALVSGDDDLLSMQGRLAVPVITAAAARERWSLS